ncbi:MAG: hypothetical protein GY801_29205 [bacterium]|nr:hypothetical protein [bacterium]
MTNIRARYSIIMFTYRAEDFRDLIEAKPDLYLKVLDKKGKELYTSGKPVRYEAERIEVFNIKIKERTKKQ